MTSLSLLSRGNGQVLKHGQRLEVHFEPEDYFNWKNREGLLHLNGGPAGEQSCWSYAPHKTFSTRKGALILYAENLALPSWKLAGGKKARHGRRPGRKRLEIELRTLRDLAGAILSYGSRQKRQDEARWQPYLHFLTEQDNKIDRQMQPGYSAKRYLSCLSQTWDPSTVYRLQCAGCLQDSALLPTNPTNAAAPSRRLQDLSAAPAQYHLLPAYTAFHSLPHLEPRRGTNTGQCSPVPEEREYEDGLQEGWEGYEEDSRKGGRVPAPTRATKRKLGSEVASQSERVSMWAGHESHVTFPEVTQLESHQSEERSTKEDQEQAEIPSKTGGHSFGSISLDASPLQSGKSHTTFYGGPFSGRKKSHSVKQGHMKIQDDREEHELPVEGGFLPPIPSTLGPDHGATREANAKHQVHETLKLPPISEESARAHPQRKIRNRASDPPKELLVLPLVVHFQTQYQTKEEAKDEGETTHESSKSEFADSENLGPTQNDPVLVQLPEGRVNNLQMDIDWNPENYPDAQPVVPTIGRLPPINGKKGPGNQSSKANLKASSNNSSSNNSSNNNSSRGLPTGTIRGTLPEELREFSKGSSVGSLIMGPDGEIICLSLLGSVQDTDIPVQLDFITDEACLSLVSEASQEEEWPGIQQQSELQDSGGLSLQSSTNFPTEPPDGASSPTLEDTNTPFINKEDTVNRTLEPSEKILTKEHVDRKGSGSIKKRKSLSPSEDTSEPTESSIEAAVMRTEDPSVTVIDMENRAGQDDGNVASSKSPEMDNESEDKVPTLQDENPRGLELVPGRSSPTEPKQTQPLTVDTSEMPSQQHNEPASGAGLSGTEKRQQDMETESLNVPPVRQLSVLREKEILVTDSSLRVTAPPGHSLAPPETAGSTQLKPGPSAGAHASQAGPPPMTEEEELAALAEVSQQTSALITKENPAPKDKGKKRPKKETPAKPPAAPREARKKTEKPKTKSVFVVGKPKEKKSEEKLETSSRKDSTQETTEAPKADDVQEEEEEDGDTGSPAVVVNTELAITVIPASRSSTPLSARSEEAQPSENLALPSEEQPLIPEDYPEETEPESQGPVKGRVASAHPSITVSLLSEENAGSETSEQSHPGTSRQDKSSRDRLRAEQAERRRLEVEKKRREREEQKRLEQEQLERMEGMKAELEREQERRSLEMRMRKQQLEEEQRRREQEALRKAQMEQQAQERARLQQEEYRRKLLEMQRRKQQEELERAEMEEQRKKEREQALAEERQRLQEMAEDERQEYYRRKQEEEERARREEEEQRQRAEEHRRLALEEAQRQAQLFARQRAALERQLNFQRELMKESVGMDQTQDISRPWVFSYFQLLEMLGLQPTVEEK